MTFYAISPTYEENMCSQPKTGTSNRHINDLFLFFVLMELTSREEKRQQNSNICLLAYVQKTEFIWRTKVRISFNTTYFFSVLLFLDCFSLFYPYLKRRLEALLLNTLHDEVSVLVDQSFKDLRMAELVCDKDKKQQN